MLKLLSSLAGRRRPVAASVGSRARCGVEALEARTLLSVPAGFTETRVATGLSQPVQMQFAPDGRLFITEKTGGVRVMTAEGQLLLTPFMNLTVNSEGERGALGITFDPNFATNRYLYVYYTATTPTVHNRLSRFTADPGNPNVVLPGSEVPLMDFDPLGSVYHNSGALHFGPDGKLYVSVGDNVKGVVAQQMTNLWGKILRLNSDGSIPTDNPFYNTNTGVNRAIWAYGLRNAFTFAFQPGTGLMYLNEVGNDRFEEINVGRAGGNYGWPDTEGPTTDPRFDTPIYYYAHDVNPDPGVITANAITGALFYNPSGGANQLPASYVGKYFFGDLAGGIEAGKGGGWIKTYDPATGQVAPFGTNTVRPVDFDIGPDGSLYYLSNSRPGSPGHVYRINYVGAASDLNITTPPDDVTAPVGRAATFTVQAQGTGTLTYQWQRDGVNIAGANQPTYSIPAAALADSGAVFRVLVSNGTDTVVSDGATLTVLNSQPPVPVITTPAAGATFAGGVPVSFAGTATDPDEVLGPDAFTWRVDYITGGVERQAMTDLEGTTGGTFTPATDTPFLGTDVVYRVVLSVRDSTGLVGTTSVDLAPQVGAINLATEPADHGLRLTLDGTPLRGAGAAAGVVGVGRVLVAPPTQVVNGVTFNFVRWSDNVTDSTRAVTTGAAATGLPPLTAVYQPVDNATGGAGAADLTSAVVVPPPASMLTGGKGRMSVRVTNQGQTAVSAPLAFAIVASPDAFMDPEDPAVATVTRPVRLAPGQSRVVKLNFTVASNVPAGNYQLLVRPDAGGGVPETVEFNNVSATPAAVVIAPPFSDLTGTFGPATVAGLGTRRQVRATLALQNNGNSTYAGPVTIALLASTNAAVDGADVPLATPPARVMKLKANGRRVIRLRSPVTGLAPGTYYLVVLITPSGTPGDTNAANNNVVSGGTFTV